VLTEQQLTAAVVAIHEQSDVRVHHST